MTKRAVIVVDVQEQYFDGILRIQHPAPEDSLANVERVLDAAVEQNLPVAIVQHELAEQAPVFAKGSDSWRLRPEIQSRVQDSWTHVTKNKGSVFAGTDLAGWLADREVDTITLVGFMTNNCDLASAVYAEELGLAAEVLSDASGAIHLANDAGKVSAEQLHETLMTLLNSNFAAVASTDQWLAAAASGDALPKSNLGESAAQGAAAFGA